MLRTLRRSLAPLGRLLRKKLLQAKPGHKLTLRKVKGHSGSIWNEIADALAAIGRTIATGRQPVTAELLDRVKRAIEAIGGDEAPDVTCQGFAWT